MNTVLALAPEVVAAWVALAASLATAFVTFALGRRASQAEARTAKSLEELKARLEERKSERDARRDYEYEARKRLYERCEPRLFAIVEHADEALHRIFSLARTAREGDLKGPSSWLASSADPYYLRSTVHRLLAPMVEARLLQRDLTLVDLALDERLRVARVLGKRLVRALTDAFDLARRTPPIPYAPDWSKPPGDPAFPQGFVVGDLEAVLDAMVVTGAIGATRCMTFGEFDRACGGRSRSATPFEAALDLFTAFAPEERPILWRLLLVEAMLCRALIRLSDSTGSVRVDPGAEATYALLDTDLDRLRSSPDATLAEPALEAAQTHIRESLSAP